MSEHIYQVIPIDNLADAISAFLTEALVKMRKGVEGNHYKEPPHYYFLKYRLDDGFTQRRTFGPLVTGPTTSVLVLGSEAVSGSNEEPCRSEIAAYTKVFDAWVRDNPPPNRYAKPLIKLYDSYEHSPLSAEEIAAVTAGIKAVIPIASCWNSAENPGGQTGSWAVVL